MSYQYLSRNKVLFPVSDILNDDWFIWFGCYWRVTPLSADSFSVRLVFVVIIWQVASWSYWHSFLNCFCEASDTLTPHANSKNPLTLSEHIKYPVLIPTCIHDIIPTCMLQKCGQDWNILSLLVCLVCAFIINTQIGGFTRQRVKPQEVSVAKVLFKPPFFSFIGLRFMW